MTKRWTGVVLVVCLGVTAPARAQTLPPGPGLAPTPEPLPCAPSGTGVPQAMIPRLVNRLTGTTDGTIPIAVPPTVRQIRIAPSGVTFSRAAG